MVCNMSFLYADHITNVLVGQAADDTSPGSQQCMMMRDTKKKISIALRGNIIICSECLSTFVYINIHIFQLYRYNSYQMITWLQTLLRSTAASQAVLPTPTTTTRLPL